MKQLQVFATSHAFENVAYNRPWVSTTELNEMVLDKLVNGIAIFSYYTKDGEERHVYGTLKPELLPVKLLEMGQENIMFALNGLKLANDVLAELKKPKEERDKKIMAAYKEAGESMNNLGQLASDFVAKLLKPKTERKKSLDTQTYFDLTEQAWKSYRLDQILALIIPEL